MNFTKFLRISFLEHLRTTASELYYSNTIGYSHKLNNVAKVDKLNKINLPPEMLVRTDGINVGVKVFGLN